MRRGKDGWMGEGYRRRGEREVEEEMKSEKETLKGDQWETG